MNRYYYKCKSAKDAVVKLEMVHLPGASHYYWTDVRALTFYYSADLKWLAEGEYEFQKERFREQSMETLRLYYKDKDKWVLVKEVEWIDDNTVREYNRLESEFKII